MYSFYWLSIDLCWLLTLGTFWSRTGEGRMIVPLYYWNSVLLRPDESFCTCLFWFCFLFVCLISPQLEKFKGECFCKVEGQEKRTMTTRKITFPLEEKKNKKKSMAVLCFSIFWNVPNIWYEWTSKNTTPESIGSRFSWETHTGNMLSNILWQQFQTLTPTTFLSTVANRIYTWSVVQIHETIQPLRNGTRVHLLDFSF